ncbi:hypothetical protein Bacsa_3694 (plasmid) [Phocaeicola salanitronis DSM 18170]|uniref:Uncharacterized protein n=2 Tax=Phocaeicola salanitronis TaxID=376805 RepID=F0R994_PHOSB|nr:hypothetical protein Bacsa_3694 [Phocaeicola salanitronis DSM 18170]
MDLVFKFLIGIVLGGSIACMLFYFRIRTLKKWIKDLEKKQAKSGDMISLVLNDDLPKLKPYFGQRLLNFIVGFIKK